MIASLRATKLANSFLRHRGLVAVAASTVCRRGAMEDALRKANTPVETHYYDTEGHGFYKPEHQQEFYTRLLAFLSRSLGGGVATTGGGTDKSGK